MKSFKEAFPSLKLSGEAAEQMEHMQVERVTVNTARDHMKIYLQGTYPIHKEIIFETERAIERQLCFDFKVRVTIVEHYTLSPQFTARRLMDVYRDSILAELRARNIFLYDMFRRAGIGFTDESRMELVLDDTIVARQHKEELIRALETIFCDRCGQDLIISCSFKPAGESEQAKLARMREEEEVRRISREYRPPKDAEDDKAFLDAGADKKKPAAKSSRSSAEKAKSEGTAGKGRTLSTAAGGRGRAGASGKGSASRRAELRRSTNPDVIYGRDFEEDAEPLSGITGEEKRGVVVRGRIISMEEREIRSERHMVSFVLTDYTDSIIVKLFVENELMEELHGLLKKGMFVKVKGFADMDDFQREVTVGHVVGIRKTADFRDPRMDLAPVKRVELHCHTKMSDMDGVSDVKDIIETAMSWGHQAIAVTDHGAVQAFPDAAHALPKDSDFKVIYGLEAYLVDDLKDIVTNSRGQSLRGSFVVFDLETTGFSPAENKIIEIGAVRVEDGKITDTFSTFVNPEVPIPLRIEELTSITDRMVMEAETIEAILPRFLEFCRGAVLVAHNAAFDLSFIEANCRRLGLDYDFTGADTVAMARVLLPELHRFKLDTVAKAVGVSLEHHHRAVDDAACTAQIFLKFIAMLEEKGITDLDGVNELGRSSEDQIKKLPTYHCILLAKNDIGRINLYRLVSWSHLKYFSRFPRIPKSLLSQYREGLLVGSACEAGELYRAVIRGASEQELAGIVSFYDYLEIQPIGNNLFMTRKTYSDPKTVEELQDYNRTIVRLGEQYLRPVAATCDVHFLNPEDEIYRRIIMSGKKFDDADLQPPLYLHTTEEMLREFEYLGEEKAYEVVVTNTVRIADMCEKISPVRPDKCPPVIEDSDRILTEICYNKAHEVYGEELPPVVEERLERELNSIISNGFAVMYIIAQKLVWKSVADGYLVGSRGSVGSSFVATMAGITEVNPLSPHYICPKCHYSDFTSPEVKKFAGMAGCDMPDKTCPVCGEPLSKEGFDIPFETFLGFKGNKEPDIDLNFSGEYQSKAHKYTEVIFGAGQTYRAGTIGTLAEKTAFGFVKHYYEEHGQYKRTCEIDRIVNGCVGIRRTTGQHPGGIIVLPYGEEIYSFTPVQHPANDPDTDIITTHFDYHSIDHNLLKLDILGHDDPSMIRMLEDLTDVDARAIPLDDKQVMSLFQGTEALGITPEQIGGCPLGSLGIPEFGTDFAMQMLVDTKPKYFSDLVRIAGLAHGTDVWLGNAQTLIKEGKATISTAICTRDDIMTYLIEKGLDKERSFTIMESVRKGKGLKPEWEEDMRDHDVPDWYVWSCKKIKYMFPKAHAAAYVMMAWRIAWFKINRPLAYYAAFFSIRASGFDYRLMCLGEERLLAHMADFESRMDSLSKKEEDVYRDMRIVREMYERGFEFMPIDLERVHASRFQIIDGKLMPSLCSIDGMGAKAAEGVTEAVRDGMFLSKQDFRDRAKVSKTIADQLEELGILTGLPETNQLSIFDIRPDGE